jgi:hypothetical protein
MILLAGVGAAAIIQAVPGWPQKAVVSAILIGAGGHLAFQSYRASFVFDSDPRNPYVYAQTLPDVTRLVGDLEQITGEGKSSRQTEIQVIWQDGYYWPLPWYLRQFEQVGYWTRMPPAPGAPLVIASPHYDAALTAKLDATHLMTGYYGIRPNVLAQLWVRIDLWEEYLRRRGQLGQALRPAGCRRGGFLAHWNTVLIRGRSNETASVQRLAL